MIMFKKLADSIKTFSALRTYTLSCRGPCFLLSKARRLMEVIHTEVARAQDLEQVDASGDSDIDHGN